MKTIKNVVDASLCPTVVDLLAQFKKDDENYERKMRWRKEISIDDIKAKTGNEPQDYSADVEYNLIKQEDITLVRKAIDYLNSKKQYIIWLYYYENKTLVEIANELGVSKIAIHKQLQRIKNDLKIILEKLL